MNEAVIDATDAEVLLAARGDREAFARLVAATRSLVASIALAELRDADAARDVAQDVYLQVWNDLRELRHPASFLPFLRQVTRQRARRVGERRVREIRGPAADASLAGAVDPGLDPGTRLLRAEQASIVQEALAALPEDARETVVLYYLEGHSAARVARLLGLTEGAVYQRLSRARVQLRSDILARLGDTLGSVAPAAAFSAAVLAALPSGASALGAVVALAPAASSVAGKASVAGGVVAVLAILAVVGSLVGGGGAPGGGSGAGGNAIARPSQPVTRDEPASAPAAAALPVEGGLDVRVTSSGRPVPGSDVRLYRRVPIDTGTGRPAWQVTGTARTDADGQVRLGASPGAWLVTARSAGLAPAQVEVVHPAGTSFSRVEVDLSTPTALSGRVVARPAGEPVPLATLWLERESSIGLGLAYLPVEERFGATSDPGGAFRVEGLAPGRYRLVVEAPGFARTSIREVAVPRGSPLVVEMGAAAIIQGVVTLADGRMAAGAEVTFVGGAELLAVATGPGGGYSAEVHPGSYRVAAVLGSATGTFPHPVAIAAGSTARADVRLGAASSLAGRVHDHAGAPIQGALAVLSPARAAGEVARALSRDDGTFEVGPLAAGEYDLDFVADGRSRASRSGLVVLAGQRFEIDVRMDGVGSVEGVVRDPDGAPVEGARVSGGKTWGGAAGSVPAAAVTGADGRYALPGLETGVTTIRARRSEGLLGARRTVEVEAGRRVDADFVLGATGAVEGDVRFADGRPADGDVVVRFVPDQPVLRAEDTGRTEVDDGGRYRVELPAGDYKAIAVKRGRAAPRSWTKVKVVGGETARLDLVARTLDDEPGTLTVQVLEPGGAPAGQAAVVVDAEGFHMMVTVGDDGRGEVGRRPGPARVTASKGGRQSLPVDVAESAREVVVQLQPAAAVRGKVVAGGSAMPRGFTLDVEIPQPRQGYLGGSERRHFSGDRFEIVDLPSGPARLVVTTPDGQAGEANLSLAPGETVERDIALRPAGVVLVRPVGPDGRPVDGAYVVLGSRMVDTAMDGLFYEGPGGTGPGRLDRQRIPAGTVVVEDVPAGRQQIRVGARLHEEVVREVDVPPGQVVDLGVVKLAPGSR